MCFSPCLQFKFSLISIINHSWDNNQVFPNSKYLSPCVYNRALSYPKRLSYWVYNKLSLIPSTNRPWLTIGPSLIPTAYHPWFTIGVFLNPELLSPKFHNRLCLILRADHHVLKSVYNWAYHFHTHTEVEPSALSRYISN